MTALSELVHVSANVFQKRAFRLFRRAFAAHKPDPDRFARFILFPGRFPAVSFPVCVCVSFPVFVLTVSRRAVPDCFRSAASGDALSSRGFLTSRCLPAGKFCVLSDRVFCAAGRAGNRFYRSECHDKDLSSAASLPAACRRAVCLQHVLPAGSFPPAGFLRRPRGKH